MALGFLVEKFDLFLELVGPSLAGRALSLTGQKFGNAVGLMLIVLGVAMVALAGYRFVRTARSIDNPEVHARAGVRADLLLAFLIGLLGVALFFYLTHALVERT